MLVFPFDMFRDFNESMKSLCPSKKWTTKLSSAGLVYFHFGHNVIAELTSRSADDPVVKMLFDKMYANFVEEVDGIDNGIDPHPEKPRWIRRCELAFSSMNSAVTECHEFLRSCYVILVVFVFELL